jgi:hypothetical protein
MFTAMNKIHDCQLIGTGTAGLCFIIALINKVKQASEPNKLKYKVLLDSLIAIEGSHQSGGVLDSYQINANTDADEIVSCLLDGTPFGALRNHYLEQPETRQALIPLPKVGELMLRPIANIISSLLGDRLLLDKKVKRIEITKGVFQSYDSNDQLITRSKKMVLCCGGSEELLTELLPWQQKTVMTGALLRLTAAYTLPSQSGSVVIVGSSHSGFSVAWRFLNDPELSSYAKGRDIIILQRNPLVKLRCTPEFAQQHQLPFDVSDDVCPVNGLVYRNAGLRKDAKALYLQIIQGEEKRVHLEPMSALSDVIHLLDEAALVVQCTGFRANLPKITMNGITQKIKPRSKLGELSDIETGKAIPNLFGLGLGIQIIPEGDYRGEKSFSGSSDGVLPYPNAVAPVIIDQLVVDQ